MSDVVPTRVDRPQPPDACAARYELGALIAGKYRLEALLGEGGMGSVWLARNLLLQSTVALKLIHPAIQGEETLERFLLEARLQARLTHPNIVRVFDLGQTDLGDPFIVMEVLQGVTLADLMQDRGSLPAIDAVQIMLPVIDALCYVHADGIVHRDLKPENIFLTHGTLEPIPKLLDFGIAKLADEPLRHATQGGVLLGSPAYMAPEQAQGLGNIDHRADIWAICIVLHEMVSGIQAFPAQGHDMLHAIVEAPVPALEETGAGEGALFRILSRGLQKNPADRFQSMCELGTALAQWLCDRGQHEDLHGGRISRTWRVTAEDDASDLDFSSQPARFIVEEPVAEDVLVDRIGKRQRGRVPRLALVAAIVLPSIAVPTKLRFEATNTRAVADNGARARALTKPAPLPAPVALADTPTAPVVLTESIASAAPDRANFVEKRQTPASKPYRKAASEAELGLKVPY